MKTETVYLQTSAYQEIVRTIGSKPAEQGGVLLMKDGIICRFIHDKNANTTGATYEVDIDYINPLLKKYKKQGETLAGIIHSHPVPVFKPSAPDVAYFKNTISNFKSVNRLFVPIVFSALDTGYEIFPYLIDQEGRVEDCNLSIVPDDYSLSDKEAPQKEQEEVKNEEVENVENIMVSPQQHSNVSVVLPMLTTEISTEEEAETQSTPQEETSKMNMPFWLQLTLYKGWIMIGLAFLLILLGLSLVLLPAIYEAIKFQLLTL